MLERYRIADFLVDIDARWDYVTQMCRGYRCDAPGTADFTLRVSEAHLQRERDGIAAAGQAEHHDRYLEAVALYRQLCRELPTRDAMMLHASFVTVAGHGIAFMAPSGVGKSTHTALWQQRFGDRLTVVNGDKPILRFFGDTAYGYGTPWAGKEGWQTPTRAAVTDLCFIERSAVNTAEPIDPLTCLRRIALQLLTPESRQTAEALLSMLDRLIGGCRAWLIRCNTDPQAADIAAAAILGEET